MTLKMQRLPSNKGPPLLLISQLKGQTESHGDFAQMRQALESGVIDAYVLNDPKP